VVDVVLLDVDEVEVDLGTVVVVWALVVGGRVVGVVVLGFVVDTAVDEVVVCADAPGAEPANAAKTISVKPRRRNIEPSRVSGTIRSRRMSVRTGP